jgi:hypothetical protein
LKPETQHHTTKPTRIKTMPRITTQIGRQAVFLRARGYTLEATLRALKMPQTRQHGAQTK